jgi:hypothetical protein
VGEGRAYFQNDAGETTVVAPGDKLNVVAKNKLVSESDELFRAALVPGQGQIFSRSTKYLYCIGPASAGAARGAPAK